MEPRTRPSSAAADTSEIAPVTLEGWYVLHQLFRMDWPLLKSLSSEELEAVAASLAGLADDWEASEVGWSAPYLMAANGIDLMLLHFRDDLEGLMDARHRVSRSCLGDLLVPEGDNLSIVELGLYGLTAELVAEIDPADREAWIQALEGRVAAERAKPFVQRRLRPTQPDDMPYVCYYPMDKRRSGDENWYQLSLAERARMMQAHGSVGRRYAGRISQVISGSIGLADWEWAVTLFAADPVDFKGVVTEMRYDEASARYAEFGQFFVGKRATPAEIGALLTAPE